ncbi:hypothetical protein [Methanothermococcus thermolithotrophicus]|uniref:hypothetical protein n=1 Tax=Methanothermococcus thermolithotrophicus TaxID=2186 RepID=UPI00037DFAC9|nr:hypothetical protein [Methanothermococcus thermolithotrophicus]
MAKSIFQIDWRTWLLKTIAVGVILGGIFWYSSHVSLTMSDIITTMAKTPLILILLIELIDKFVDMNDIYSRIYLSVGRVSDIEDSAKKVFISLLISGIGFLGILWALTGTFTLALGSLSAGPLIVSALYATYILAPETGDDELLLFLWLGATIATGGQHIMIMPPIPGLSTLPGIGTTLF